MRINQPYHEGEIEVQRRLGEAVEAQRNGRAIADSILPGALRFIESQPLIALGTVASGGEMWASVAFGEPGFVRPDGERRIRIDLRRAVIAPLDPCLANVDADPRVGVLFIEPVTRRRLRVNGRASREGDRLQVSVTEAYPNCPKYVQRRHLRLRGNGAPTPGDAAVGASMNAHTLALIRAADTAFVASSHPEGNLDVSHRGGAAGFIRAIDERTLLLPDYPGNHMYNTLGNLTVNPRAGLTLVDFEAGRILMMTGDTEILWNESDREAETGGTGRFWTLRVARWISIDFPVSVTSELLESSPFNPELSPR